MVLMYPCAHLVPAYLEKFRDNTFSILEISCQSVVMKRKHCYIYDKEQSHPALHPNWSQMLLIR